MQLSTKIDIRRQKKAPFILSAEGYKKAIEDGRLEGLMKSHC